MRRKEKYKDTHIRVEQDTFDAVKEIADQYDQSIAWGFRTLLDDTINIYNSHVVYVDPEQGKQVLEAIRNLQKEYEQARLQLSRIGNNVNQIAKAGNTALKEIKDHPESSDKITVTNMTDEQVSRIIGAIRDVASDLESEWRQNGAWKWQS